MFSYDEMNQYVDIVVDDMIAPWLDDTWPGIPIPEVDYCPGGAPGYEGCTDYDGQRRPVHQRVLRVLPARQHRLLGQDCSGSSTSSGDAAPAMGIAHEFGHHVQEYLGVDPPYTAARASTTRTRPTASPAPGRSTPNEQAR